jgi:hypothetical protein
VTEDRNRLIVHTVPVASDGLDLHDAMEQRRPAPSLTLAMSGTKVPLNRTHGSGAGPEEFTRLTPRHLLISEATVKVILSGS